MFKKSLITFVLAAAASGSFAQIYVQGALGQGKLSGACSGLSSCSESGTGSKFLAGYELGNGFSAQGLYINYGKASATVGAGYAEAKASGYGLGIGWKNQMNPSWAVQTGLSLNNNKTTESSTTAATTNTSSPKLNLGLGVSYKLTDTVSAVGELDLSSAKDKNGGSNSARLISIGIRASF